MPILSPKFIYFDLDDTLLDHKKAEQAGLRDVHKFFDDHFEGIAEDHLIDTYHYINKGLWEEYGKGEIDRHMLHRRRFEETFKDIGIDEMLYEEAGKVYMDFYENHWDWLPGAEEAYQRIAEKYKVGIITNGFSETQRLKISKFNFEETASHIVISEDVGVMKPHPKVFDHATKLTGVKRNEILYVGDSFTSDVIGGHKAGWKTAWFTSQPHPEGEKIADLVFKQYDKLIKALGI